MRSGGKLVASFRSEPRTFNRLVSPRAAEELVTRLTQAPLIRFNRTTRALDPWLADRWTSSPDKLTWTLHLREGVTFSDGTPFTSDDVVFTFAALYDPVAKTDVAESLVIDGKPIGVSAPDKNTVVLKFPAPYGPGIALLDSLPILPRHKLAAAVTGGTFREAWGVDTPVADLAGLGPFVIREYKRGERMVFARNPHYWRKDDAGVKLPYLDEIEVQFVADQNTEVLRLQAGESDLLTDLIRAEDVASFRKAMATGQVGLVDAGISVSPDWLVFNLVPGAAVAAKRPWLQREELRQAVSYAVDRQALVDTVYLGAAVPVFGPITPGHGEWYLADGPRTDYDQSRARTLLATIGLRDRDGDGTVDDESGKSAAFSLLVQKGTLRERVAVFLKDQLAKVGLTVDVAALDQLSLIDHWQRADYDAMYHYILFDTPDPSRNLEFWASSGGFHFWDPGQKKPATAWEAEIDAKMRAVSSTMDEAARVRAFADVQRVMAAHLPIVYFIAPRVMVPMSGRVRGATPAVLLPLTVLWNADSLWIARDGPRD